MRRAVRRHLLSRACVHGGISARLLLRGPRRRAGWRRHERHGVASVLQADPRANASRVHERMPHGRRDAGEWLSESVRHLR
eukprot:5945710-Prymnesium_polylepis.4